MAFLVAAVEDFLVTSTDVFLVTSTVDEDSIATYTAAGHVAVMTTSVRSTLAFVGGAQSVAFDYQPTPPLPSGGIEGVTVAATPATGVRIGGVEVIKARSGGTVIWE